MKNVKIDIESTVEELDDAGLVESSDKTASSAVGTLTESSGSYVISYSVKNENETALSEITVTDSSVTVKRSGDSEYKFVFTEGKATNSLYAVGQYSFDTEIYTRKIRKSLSDSGGELTLIYDMTIGGAKKKTRMKILVSER